ncbi:serine/threonine-protein kinase [Actinomyces faecalis]|uniref:serine/threonine-protein kinase n=1 Tax=Actinomyces faecalis TaxID=2722820 RepID=UPI0015554D7E|nr:protein kinase [Actinomyces faecalis]
MAQQGRRRRRRGQDTAGGQVLAGSDPVGLALQTQGLTTEPFAPAGRGGRSGLLRGVDEKGHDLVIRVLDLPVDRRGERTQRRAQALRELEDPGLVGVREVLTLPDGHMAMVMDLVEGADLEVLLAARGALTRGETASLMHDLSQALACLHAAGMAHGDLSPANVMITAEGRGVLVDLMGTVRETGTPPWAAPERELGGPATPAADVYSLVAVLLGCAHGAPALSRRLRGLLADALEVDPARRPGAAELAARAEDLGRLRPIQLPQDLSAEAVRLRAQAAVPTRRPARCREHRRRPRALRSRDGRRPRSWWRRTVWTVVSVCAPVVLVVSAAVCLGPAQVGAESAPSPVTASGTSSSAAASSTPPTTSSPAGRADGQVTAEELRDAVVDLVARRDQALEDLDAIALASTTVPGSPAAEADAGLLEALVGRGAQVQGLSTAVTEVQQVDLPPEASARWPGALAARLTRTQQAYTLVEGAGARRVPVQPTQEVVLVLLPGPWRVAEVVAVEDAQSLSSNLG